MQGVRAAQKYTENQRLGDVDVAAGEVYDTSDTPPWFAPIANQLNRMDNRLIILENTTKGDGHSMPFDVVNFSANAPQNAGADPTSLGLPHLDNVTTIGQLNNNDVDAYCQGYSLGGTNLTYDKKKMMIASHIGCRDLRDFTMKVNVADDR